MRVLIGVMAIALLIVPAHAQMGKGKKQQATQKTEEIQK